MYCEPHVSCILHLFPTARQDDPIGNKDHTQQVEKED